MSVKVWHAAMAITAVVAVAAGSCGTNRPTSSTYPRVTPTESGPNRVTPTPTTKINKANTDRLCHFMTSQRYGELLTDKGEGNANVYREMSGIPSDLNENVRLFFSGEPLDIADSKIVGQRRTQLDIKMKRIKDSCIVHGSPIG